jgi:hypothetical protein
VNNKAMPRLATVRDIQEILGVDLNEAFRHSLLASKPSVSDYELFVSAPIIGLNDEAEINRHRDDVAKVVAAAENVVDKVYWSGKEVASFNDLGAPDIAAEASLEAFVSCQAYLYLQFAEMVNPSGALVELGFALGRRLKTTLIIKKDLRTPAMLEGFQGVAAKLGFLPETHIYVVDDVEGAVRLIQQSGGQLLR